MHFDIVLNFRQVDETRKHLEKLEGKALNSLSTKSIKELRFASTYV